MLKKIMFAAALAASAAAANAAVLTLESVTAVGGNYRYVYQATFGPDEGLKTGDSLILFDFAGYVDGSVMGSGPWVASTELTSATPFIIPGETDDATLANLVFTYTGPDNRVAGGPYSAFNLNGIGAVSAFGTTTLDGFTSFTTKNNPADAAGTPLIQAGLAEVPSAVPEPSSWALMILGFGLTGLAARRRAATLPTSA